VQVGARFMVWVSSILKTIGVTSGWLCSLQPHFREGIDQMYLFFSIGFYPQWSRGFLLCFRNKTKSVCFVFHNFINDMYCSFKQWNQNMSSWKCGCVIHARYILYTPTRWKFSKYQLKVYLEQWNLSYSTQEYSKILNNS
jgi:hypothetical protein